MHEENNGKLRLVYSMKLAGYLMQKGFRLVRKDKDRKNPKYDVFFFRENNLLLDAIDEYKSKCYKPDNNV